MATQPQPPEDFAQLRKLLALKRHEQPPPGFYNRLPGRIMARIQAEEETGSTHWVVQLWQSLLARPYVSGAFGLLVLTLISTGLILSGKYSQPGHSMPDHATPPWELSTVGPTPGGSATEKTGAILPTELTSSTNPVNQSQPPPSLFGPVGLPVEKVGFQKKP